MSSELKNIFDLWPALEVRHLAAFKVVAATGSLAQGARELGYTQPAISHQLATLERLIGARLFERGSGRRHATLTAAGEIFARHVDVLESQLGSAHADLAALDAGAGGVVRVGAFQSVSARVLPPLVGRLASSDESVSLALTESADETDLVAGLVAGKLDFAFVLMPVEDTRLEAVELLRDPYHLVGAIGGPYRLELDSLRELAGTPLIAPRTCRSWTMVADQIRAAGVTIDYAFRTDDNLAIKGLVQSGAGVAFLSRMTLEKLDDGLEAAPVGHLLEARRIGLAWTRSRVLLPYQELFLSVARDVCDTIAEEHRRAPEDRAETSAQLV